MIPALFAKLATCVDPFIYTLNQTKVRNEISLRLHTIFLRAIKLSARPAAAPTYTNPANPGSSRVATN